ERFGARLRLFNSCIGSDGCRDLKGSAKAAWLEQRFPQGFSYVGGSARELATWQSAGSAIVAGAPPAVKRGIDRLDAAVEAEFPRPRLGAALLEQLRLHQWSKNILVVLPLLLAH